MKVTGDFPLRLFLLSKEPEAAADHLIFFGRQYRLHGIQYMTDVFSGGILFHNVDCRSFHYIQKTDLITFFVCTNGFVQRDFPGCDTSFGRRMYQKQPCEVHENALGNSVRGINKHK